MLIELNERVEKIVKENTVAIRSREKVLGQLVKESSERGSANWRSSSRRAKTS